MKYTPEGLDQAAIADLLNDAEASEKQAKEGPFFPERNITPGTLLEYAKECRQIAERYSQGGAHEYILKGGEK